MHATVDSILKRMTNGLPVICMPVRLSRTPNIAYVAQSAGFHALYVDMEHSPIPLDEAGRICLAASSLGLAALIRVNSHDKQAIVAALESGATGIIVPHVENAEEAAAIVRAARFPPLGSRAGAGESVALGYQRFTQAEAAAFLNARTLVIAMLESTNAIGNAEGIAAIPGIDVLLVGTGDLSAELGIEEVSGNPKILDIYRSVASVCQRHDRCLGVAGIKNDPPMLRTLFEMGARFFSASTDESLLLRAARDEAARLAQIK